jgi:hypothetical protein
MDLHTSLQYPFFKFLIEELSGSFFQNDLTSLHRILILYHNRYIFSIQGSNIPQFLDDHQQGLTGPDWLYRYLPRVKQQKIRQVRLRTAFILKHNRCLIEEMLLRKDYSSPETVRQTLLGISQWLENQPASIFVNNEIDVDAWKKELSCIIEQFDQVNRAKKPSKSSTVASPFHEILIGADQAERRDRFNVLTKLLMEHKWVIPTQTADMYQFHKQHKGGRLYIGALYYALNEMGYVSKALDGPQIAVLFDSFLIHNFEQGSFIKVFQPEEQAQFDCGPNDQRYKYVSQARLLLKDF